MACPDPTDASECVPAAVCTGFPRRVDSQQGSEPSPAHSHLSSQACKGSDKATNFEARNLRFREAERSEKGYSGSDSVRI